MPDQTHLLTVFFGMIERRQAVYHQAQRDLLEANIELDLALRQVTRRGLDVFLKEPGTPRERVELNQRVYAASVLCNRLRGETNEAEAELRSAILNYEAQYAREVNPYPGDPALVSESSPEKKV